MAGAFSLQMGDIVPSILFLF